MKNILFAISASAIILASYSCGNKGEKISGAGATFPAPFYNIVFKDYAKSSGNEVTYGAIGSGGGIRSLKDKTTDFGASDVFLSDDEMKEMGAEVVHIPTALGAVSLSYNLPEIENKELKLTAEIISDIYRNKITKWNDAKIKAINPELNLPDKAITPVYRSDGSGTTYVFSDYMSKADSLWKKDIGAGKSLTFPAGIAAKGNPGVAGIIAETNGSIGYIGSEYAMALSIPSAIMMNSSGNFIKPDNQSISLSADIDIPDDTRVMITNSFNPNAYPISTFTWIIVYKEQAYNSRSKEKAQALVKLLDFVTNEEGQNTAEKTHYAPLSGNALEKAKKAIGSISFNGEAINE